LYVDGGLTNNFPVEPLLISCYKIIGVNVSSHNVKPKISGLIEITERCLQLAVWNTIKDRIIKCDVIIDLDNAFNYSMFSIKKSEPLFKIGYDATIEKMDLILKSIN
jgi:NTE family protein